MTADPATPSETSWVRPSEGELIERRPNDDTLRDLIEEFGPAVFRCALGIVRDRAMAEDVSQETLIKVWTSFGSFRGEGSMRGWVLRIAHNEAVSALRKVRDEAWAPDQLPEAESTDATADPDQLAKLLGDAAEIKVVLDALDPLTRSILILREAEGLSYDEIAETVGAPVSTIRARLFRLRQGFERARLAANERNADAAGAGSEAVNAGGTGRGQEPSNGSANLGSANSEPFATNEVLNSSSSQGAVS